jgi:starvation-inducible DNA-binding protein
MNNPFNDKINKAVAEAARKVMEQTLSESYTLHAVHPEKDDRKKKLGSFASKAEAAAHINKLEDSGKFPEGHEAVLTHNATGEKHVYTDKWEKLDEGRNIFEAQEEHVKINARPHLHEFMHGTVEANYGGSREEAGEIEVPKHHADKAEEALKQAKQKGMDLRAAGASADEGKNSHKGQKIPKHALDILDRYMYEEFQQIDERGMVGMVNRMKAKSLQFKAGGGHKPGAAPLSQRAVADRVAAGRKIQKADTGPKQTGDRKADARARIADLKNSRGYGSHLPEEAEQIAEKAKWRSSSAAKPDPDHDWDRSPRSTGGMRATSDKRGDTGGEYNHSSLENRKKAQVVAKTGKTTKASNTSLKGRIRGNLANKQPKPNLPEEAKKKVVVKTNEPIGYKIADIGPGGKEYNIKTDKAWDKKLKKEEVEQIDEGGNYGKKYDAAKHIASMTNAEIEKRIAGWEEFKQKNPNMPHRVTHDQLAMLRAERASRIGKKKTNEEVEQIDEAPYMGKGNHKPGWMLRADPKLAKAFKDAQERIEQRRARQAKWAGVSIPSKSDKMEEETSHIAERLLGRQRRIDANENGKIDAHDFKLLRKKSKMMKESYLAEEATPALSAAMKAILADAFHMYFKAHTFHWNVEGANFPEYHKFFGDVYEQLFDTIDPIAEEIRALGEYAPRSLTELKGSTSIDDSSVQTPAEMFGSLLADNSKILAGLTNGYKVAEAAGEIGLSNFLQDKIDAHKKLGWMIKSVSKGA